MILEENMIKVAKQNNHGENLKFINLSVDDFTSEEKEIMYWNYYVRF